MHSIDFILETYSGFPEFLEEDVKSVNQVGIFGNTPLHLAAVRGEDDYLRVMLPYADDVDVRGDIGATPLHEAVRFGNMKCVQVLLAAGASLCIADEFGYRPLDIAKKEGNAALIDMLAALDNCDDRKLD